MTMSYHGTVMGHNSWLLIRVYFCINIKIYTKYIYIYFIQIYYSFSLFSFCLCLIFLSFPLLTSSTPMYFINIGLCIAWFHHQNSTVVHVLFFDAVLANEPQSINCLYKRWTVKNHCLTDLHFTNLARILLACTHWDPLQMIGSLDSNMTWNAGREHSSE